MPSTGRSRNSKPKWSGQMRWTARDNTRGFGHHASGGIVGNLVHRRQPAAIDRDPRVTDRRADPGHLRRTVVVALAPTDSISACLGGARRGRAMLRIVTGAGAMVVTYAIGPFLGVAGVSFPAPHSRVASTRRVVCVVAPGWRGGPEDLPDRAIVRLCSTMGAPFVHAREGAAAIGGRSPIRRHRCEKVRDGHPTRRESTAPRVTARRETLESARCGRCGRC